MAFNAVQPVGHIVAFVMALYRVIFILTIIMISGTFEVPKRLGKEKFMFPRRNVRLPYSFHYQTVQTMAELNEETTTATTWLTTRASQPPKTTHKLLTSTKQKLVSRPHLNSRQLTHISKAPKGRMLADSVGMKPKVSYGLHQATHLRDLTNEKLAEVVQLGLMMIPFVRPLRRFDDVKYWNSPGTRPKYYQAPNVPSTSLQGGMGGKFRRINTPFYLKKEAETVPRMT